MNQERAPTADADTAESCPSRQHAMESLDSARGFFQLPVNDRNCCLRTPQKLDSDACLQLHDKHPEQAILTTSTPPSQSIVSLENDPRGQKTDSDGNCAKSTCKLLKHCTKVPTKGRTCGFAAELFVPM